MIANDCKKSGGWHGQGCVCPTKQNRKSNQTSHLSRLTLGTAHHVRFIMRAKSKISSSILLKYCCYFWKLKCRPSCYACWVRNHRHIRFHTLAPWASKRNASTVHVTFPLLWAKRQRTARTWQTASFNRLFLPANLRVWPARASSVLLFEQDMGSMKCSRNAEGRSFTSLIDWLIFQKLTC